jgi:5-methyltetrahydrofolate--homocysteine methyltransferase
VLLATVKGDVHDIGKNIVGVVLACNNYEVIDLGVMVPEKDPGRRRRSTAWTSSGCRASSRPSLDEMVHGGERDDAAGLRRCRCSSVARRPAGAHASVKIAPQYAHGVVHVLDASRVVNVVSALLSAEQKPAFLAETNDKQQAGSRVTSPSGSTPAGCCRSKKPARRASPMTGRRPTSRSPSSLGTRQLQDVPLADMVPFIDWGPFFNRVGAARRLPRILEDAKVVGGEAKKLFADAQEAVGAASSKNALHREGHRWASGPAIRSATRSSSTPTPRAARCWPRSSHAAAAD